MADRSPPALATLLTQLKAKGCNFRGDTANSGPQPGATEVADAIVRYALESAICAGAVVAGRLAGVAVQ